MSQLSDDLRQQLHKSLEELKTLRDDIRVRLHLAGMDAKTRWNNDLEPLFVEAEQHVKEAGEAARKKLSEVLEQFKSFSSSLGSDTKKPSA